MKNKKYIVIISITIIILLLILGISISKITTNNKTSELALEFEIDYDSDEDLDGDDLSNKEEKKYKTDPCNSDTDLDGIIDSEEIHTYKTDPLKADTDGDGLNDYNEIELGFDPLKVDTNGNGIKDSEEHSTYSFESDNMIISVSGIGNIADTYAFVDEDTDISSQEGAINREYSFSSEGDIDELKVSFKYSEEDLNTLGIDAAMVDEYIQSNPNGHSELKNTDIFTYLTGLGICKISKADLNDCEYLEAKINREDNTITAILENYQDYIYIIGDVKELVYGNYNSGGSKVDSSNNNLILLADSGFDVRKNGFSFRNYCTNFAKAGHCYGMALFADLYYTKELPLRQNSKDLQKSLGGIIKVNTFKPSYSYNLRDSYFSNYSNLYDYKLGIDVSKNNINEEKMQSNRKYEKLDIQLLNAIYQLFTMQGTIDHYSSGGLGNLDGLYNLSVTLGKNRVCKWDGTFVIDLLKQRLKNKEAPLLFYEASGGKHAVNVIRLYRYNNKNKYRICVYNNNNPGEEKWLDIDCGKNSCVIDGCSFYIIQNSEERVKCFTHSDYYIEDLGTLV